MEEQNLPFGSQRPSGREIRVLDLLPGSHDDAVNCEIRIVNLDGEEEYEALSYVWGERGDEKEINISEHRIQITPNLYAALRRLRSETTKRTIWIDQLCINQMDNNERASQVAMMRDIYRRCFCCIIWLGEVDGSSLGFDLDDAAEVFEFVRIVAEATTFRHSELPVLFQNSERGMRARRAFAAFSMYGNPWWSRIWTIQEAIVPRSSTIVWGPLYLPRDAVLRTTQNLRSDRMQDLFSWEFCMERLVYTPLLRRLLYPVHGFRHSEHEDGPLDLLMRWRHRDATDARDKVYALLGLILSNALPSAVGCSYEIPVPTLFEHVTLDLIRHEGGLRAFLGSSEMPHRTLYLASWAIDFACTNWIEMRQLKWWNHSHRYREFSADGGIEMVLTARDDGKRLDMSGVYIDEICHVGQVYSVSDREAIDAQSVLKVIEDAWELLEEARIWQSLKEEYFNGHSWRTAFQRTTIGDLIMEEFPVKRADSSTADLHESLLEDIRDLSLYDFARPLSRCATQETPTQSTIEIDIRHEQHLDVLAGKTSDGSVPRNMLWTSVCSMIPNHVFFITKTGYIGIGPSNTQPKDQVWVFYGGKVPFVMRSANEKSVANVRHRFHLVGDAYVHGIMDGEAVQTDHKAQSVCIS